VTHWLKPRPKSAVRLDELSYAAAAFAIGIEPRQDHAAWRLLVRELVSAPQ
jgi:hypothetical protein